MRRMHIARFFAGGVFLLWLASSSFVFAASQTLYMPVLQSSDAADLGLALSNPTTAPVTVTLTARSYKGEVLSGPTINNPVKLTLPGPGQKALRASEIFGPGVSGQTGWVQIASEN